MSMVPSLLIVLRISVPVVCFFFSSLGVGDDNKVTPRNYVGAQAGRSCISVRLYGDRDIEYNASVR